jgi:selenocysteine lyase/cysteine desulfurase
VEENLSTAQAVDWQKLRRNFPVTTRLSYLNSAATGPISLQVREAVESFYAGMLESGDRRWEEWIATRERARRAIARLINAEPDEIAFTTNTSSGMNLIVDALEGRGEVISCELEFPVSTIPWMHRGVSVNFLKPRQGELNVEDVVAAMSARTAVICLSHVQYSNGCRLDLEAVGREKGSHAFVVNASQSAGVLPIDVKRMRIDALCSTGHKWMLAGYGTGFVYLSHELLESTRPRQIGWMSVDDPFQMRNRHHQPRLDAAARAELGCPYFSSIFSLGTSTQQILDIGMTNIEGRALEINRILTERLREAGWNVLSPIGSEATRSAETLVEAAEPRRVVAQLASRNVAVTIKPEGFRVSTHYFNDEDDISNLIEALSETRRD